MVMICGRLSSLAPCNEGVIFCLFTKPLDEECFLSIRQAVLSSHSNTS